MALSVTYSSIRQNFSNSIEHEAKLVLTLPGRVNFLRCRVREGLFETVMVLCNHESNTYFSVNQVLKAPRGQKSHKNVRLIKNVV